MKNCGYISVYEPKNGNGTGSGEANTMSNIGGGVELFKTKDGVDLELRTLVAGDGVSISVSGDTVVIESTGGLSYWTESEYTYSGSTGTKFIPSSGNTNQSIVLQPKGTGAIIAQEPDGTTTGGDNRGNYAVDLQLSRTSSNQVAGGNNSVICGGVENRVAVGSYNSVVVGGRTNTVNGVYSSIVGGYQNISGGDYAFAGGGRFNSSAGNYSSVVGGYQNSANQQYSVVSGGNLNATSGQYSSIIGGQSNTASGNYSSVLGGRNNTAYSYGETVAGLYPTSYTPASTSAFDSTDRLFTLGNGTSTGTRSNALVVYKSGAVEFNEAFTFPTADGTAGQVLQTDGSGVVTWETVGGGLNYWTESEYTYSGATGTKFIPNSVNTNQSIVLQPKGTGAIIAQQPDGTTTGGNNRGDYAVDLQMVRSSSNQVASGYGSFVAGRNNQSTNSYSISIGYDNESTGQASICLGYGNIASSSQSIAIGRSNTASGTYSVALGYQSVSGGGYSAIGGGYSNEVNSDYSVIVGGNNSYIGTGSHSFIGGGDTNTINGTGAYQTLVGGRENAINTTALHYNFIGGGYLNIITESERSIILGGSNNQVQAGANYGTIIGHNSHIEASAERVIAMGTGARGRRYGEIVWTVNDIIGSATGGDNGLSKVQLKARTTTNTPTEIFLGGVSGKRLVLPNNSSSLIKVSWVRRNFTDSSILAKYDEYYTVLRGATAGTTVIDATSGGTSIGTDATGGSLSITADTTNGGVKFEVTGVSAKTLDWLVFAEILEIIH